MMNELQRQTYLSALGVDTYMPRWHLPFAPSSVACILPEFVRSADSATVKNAHDTDSNETASGFIAQQPNPIILDTTNHAVPISTLISNIFDTKKADPLKKAAAQSEFTPQGLPSVLDAFSLSVWHPFDEIMIVDSRNTKLALPTEVLLKNIFSSVFPELLSAFKEEILRCPMIENSFAKRTADDARAELQTWLSVQCEIRSIKYLWLMGENAARYVLPESFNKDNSLWQSELLTDSKIHALILPSLNELLMNPSLKKNLMSAIRSYHA